MTRKDKLLLLVPALWTSIFDITITVIHQSKEYWDGDLVKANEGNPIGALFMKNHVSGLFVISGLWIIAIGLLGYFLPRQASKIFLLFCVIAHSFGASTWLSTRYGFWYVITFILFNSILYCVVDNITHRQTV
jgi:hypothetical protein